MHMFTPDRLADARQWVDGFGARLARLLNTRWFPLAVNLLVLALLVASLARWTWRAIVAVPAPSAVATAPASATAAPFNLQPALAAQLFGAAPPQAGAVADIPVSSLNLVLTGVIAAARDGGYALIRVDGQPEASFAVGDEIVAGAVLQQVYADRVIIGRGGRMESLILEGPASLPAVSAPEPAPLAMNPRARTRAAPLDAIRQDARNAYTLPRALVNEELRNPQQLLSQSLMVPNTGGGFLVREIQPGSIYQKLGLRVGDVIRSANGQPVNTLEDAVKAYQQAANNNYIRLEIVRAGKPETLQYTLQ